MPPARLDLADLMRDTGLRPTQRQVFADALENYAEAMRGGTWDWQRTAGDPRVPMIVDTAGNILAGHHRFIAARMAGITMPPGVVKTLPASGARVARDWSEVQVVSGRSQSGEDDGI